MPRPTIKTPRYLTRFACIGPACEDHCCAGWQNVDVDSATYAHYRRLDHPELIGPLRRHVRANTDPSAGPEDAALIKVPENGCCPFLTAERWCAIQSALGEALLPTSCDTFPRQATLIEGRIDQAGRFSCPEVARLALLAPDALDPLHVEPDRRLRERAQYWVEATWPDQPREGDPRRHYHVIRDLCRSLLRRRDASLEARLRALGQALDALDAWPEVGRDEIEQIFAEAGAGLAELEAEIEATRAKPVGPAELLLRRIRPWLAMPNVPPRYGACLRRIAAGLSLPEGPVAPLGGQVRRAYAAALPHFRAYLEARPYALEHVVLNLIWLGNFPFHPERSFYDEYALLVCRHALLKLHLIGTAGAEGRLTDELLVETVQAFDKYADSADYWQRTLDLLRREGAFSPAGLAALLLE